MIGAFDHRANGVRVNPRNTHNPYLRESVGEAQHRDPHFSPQSRYWVPAEGVRRAVPEKRGWTIAYRRSNRATDVRTMIAAIVPAVGFGDSVFLLMPEDRLTAADALLLLGNLNSFGFDYVTRRKAAGTNLSWYIVEQLPVIAPEGYERTFGDATSRQLVRDHMLRLTYTAHDMAPLARGLGYDGPPFVWDAEERRHLRARLDALYFHLYGLSREDAGDILDTFLIVRRDDEAVFGRYRTRDSRPRLHERLDCGRHGNSRHGLTVRCLTEHITIAPAPSPQPSPTRGEGAERANEFRCTHLRDDPAPVSTSSTGWPPELVEGSEGRRVFD